MGELLKLLQMEQDNSLIEGLEITFSIRYNPRDPIFLSDDDWGV